MKGFQPALKSVAIVCNTKNADMTQYFLSKVDVGADIPSLVFAAHSDIANQRPGVRVSSTSSDSRAIAGSLKDLATSFSLAIRFKRAGVNICIFDTAHVSNLSQAVFMKLLGIETIFSVHDFKPHPGKASGRVRLYNWLIARVFHDRRIFFSRGPFSTDQDFIADLVGFSAEAGAKDGGYFLFFGRVEPYKGLDILLTIAKERPDSQFIVAGRGRDPALSRLSDLANVTVINEYIPDHELKALILRCTAVLLPYSSATQSGVIVQAYSHAKPVVVFDVGNLRQYVSDGETGRVIPFANIPLFSEALDEILLNYDSYSLKAATLFEARFGRDAARIQLESLIKWCRGD